MGASSDACARAIRGAIARQAAAAANDCAQPRLTNRMSLVRPQKVLHGMFLPVCLRPVCAHSDGAVAGRSLECRVIDGPPKTSPNSTEFPVPGSKPPGKHCESGNSGPNWRRNTAPGGRWYRPRPAKANRWPRCGRPDRCRSAALQEPRREREHLRPHKAPGPPAPSARTLALLS